MKIRSYWLKVLGRVAFLKLVFLIPFFTPIKFYWPALSFEILWKNFDGPYFLAIASSWYNPVKLKTFWAWLNRTPKYFPAHFPLFPFFIKVFSLLGFSLPTAGFLVSLIFSFLIVFIWIKLYQVIYKKLPPLFYSWMVLLFPPRMWAVTNVISPETLFIFLILSSFFLWLRKKYFLALITAGLTFWTKSPGFFIFAAYGLWLWLIEHKTNLRRTFIDYRSWLIIILGLVAFLGLDYFYFRTTGNFWAYFQSGNNIHLFWPPLQVFNPRQVWVGSFWLEDIVLLLTIYAFLLLRRWSKVKRSPLTLFSLLYLSSLFFIAHRDISRYSLPLVPVLLLINPDLLEENNLKTKIVLGIYLILTFFYSWNFINGNHL